MGSNAGVIGMTKEHLGLALALNLPVMCVVTKVTIQINYKKDLNKLIFEETFECFSRFIFCLQSMTFGSSDLRLSNSESKNRQKILE